MKSVSNGVTLISGCRGGGLGLIIGHREVKNGKTVMYTSTRPGLVMGTARKPERTDRWAGTVQDAQHLLDSTVLECDVANEESVDALFAGLAAQGVVLGGYVFAVAGGPKSIIGGDMFHATPEEYLEGFKVNVLGFRNMIEAGIGHKVWADNASFLALGSDNAFTWPGYGAMGPMKAALEKWTLDCARQPPAPGFRFNVLITGPVKSMAGRVIEGFDAMCTVYEQEVGWTQERAREVIGEGACELLSPVCRITGRAVYADLGMHDRLMANPPLLQQLLAKAVAG
ncbi:MAG: SDR family oxidoreductase [bacterium]